MNNIEKELTVNENPYFSPSRLNSMATCLKQGWFSHVLKFKDYSVPSAVALGNFLHKKIEKMWVKDRKTGLWVKGYKDKETCMNIAERDWKHFYAGEGKTSENHPIEWTQYDGKGYALVKRVRETMGLAYDFEMSQEPRLRAEFPIRVGYEGIKFFSILDEIRRGENGKGIVILDHKSGAEKVKEYFVQKNLQLTLNAICVFEALQHKYSYVSAKLFPEYQGITLDEFLDKDFLKVQIHDVFPRKEDGIPKGKSEIYSSVRTEHDFNEAVITANAMKKSLIDRDFHPSKGKNCDTCFFKHACDDYDPAAYHKNDFERQNPLFASAGFKSIAGGGMIFENPKENVGQIKPRQKPLRFPKQ